MVATTGISAKVIETSLLISTPCHEAREPNASMPRPFMTPARRHIASELWLGMGELIPKIVTASVPMDNVSATQPLSRPEARDTNGIVPQKIATRAQKTDGLFTSDSPFVFY